jgi:hypothetical protein
MRWQPVATVAFSILTLAMHGRCGDARPLVRGIYCHPGAALDSRLWAGYGSGFSWDHTVARTGATSIRCEVPTDGDAQGVCQTVEINQAEARPIVVSGWARLANVAGPPSYKCSVYVDCRLQNGESWPMQTAIFDPAEGGWQHAEATYTPPSPIRSARVYAFLREKSGVAWFDDLYVGEILDENGARSDNLLKSPGFEQHPTRENPERKAFFEALDALHCNAFHFYRSVAWDAVRDDKSLPDIPEDDPMRGFVRAAHQRNFGVWLTVGLGFPKIGSISDQDWPVYACVNNRWGKAYTRAVQHFARYGVDGIGVVPDEWTFSTGRLKRAYAKHADPDLLEAVNAMSSHAHCPICHTRFTAQTGYAFPDMNAPWKTADPAWAALLDFRYGETAAWMQRTIAAAKKVNPDIVTDTMICVLPVCSDDRIGAGAAWDTVGRTTDLDCLQTDPYLLLHNYRGDSTHYYATETTIHLAAANWPRQAGVTLEASRLRPEHRPKDPAEVYGTALSCLMHGAREFFWWHLNHISGKTPYVDAPRAHRSAAAAYEVMEKMEPQILGARIPANILVLYSRRSEDTWHWLARARSNVASAATMEAQAGDDGRPLRNVTGQERRGFIAHKNVLYWLLRRGYPFQTTFLEYPDPAKLRAAEVVLLPFALALTEEECVLVENTVSKGKTVILFDVAGPLDEMGRALPTPRLASLFGDRLPDPEQSEPLVSNWGKGRVVFLGGNAAERLFDEVEPQRDRSKRVPLATFNSDLTATLESLVGPHRSLFEQQPDLDIEVTRAVGPDADLILAINWDPAHEATLVLRDDVLGEANTATGLSITPDGTVREVTVAGPAVQLAPQQALLLVTAPVNGDGAQ